MPRKYLSIHLIVLIAGFLVGFSSGYFNFKDNKTLRSIAQNDDSDYIFERFYCPSLQEYTRLIEEFNVSYTGIWTDYSCDPDNIKFKVARHLYYIDKYFKLDIPSWWEGGAKEALRDTKKYLKERVKAISFRPIESDLVFILTGGKSIGYNLFGSINLGDHFFFSPSAVINISYLVHEAQHSVPGVSIHGKCVYQISHLAGLINICDEWFTTGSQADSYAYQISFLLGFARLTLEMEEDLISEAERSRIINYALGILGTQINNIPPFFAFWPEILIASNQKKESYYVHPFLRVPIPFYEPILLSSIRSFFTGQPGFNYVNKKTLYNYYKSKRPDNFRAGSNSINTIRSIKHKDGISYLISDNGILWIQHDSKKFLFFDIPKSLEQSVFQDPAGRGWVDVYTTSNSFFIHAINRDGVHFYFSPDSEHRIYKSDFQVANATSYLSTDTFQVLLNSEGRLFVKRHLEDNIVQFDFSKEGIIPTDIYYLKLLMPTEKLGFDDRGNEQIINACNLTVKSSKDPWTGLTMGITADHQLAFQVAYDEHPDSCRVLPIEGKVVDYRFHASYQKISWVHPVTKASLIVVTETTKGRQSRQYFPYSL